MLEKLTASNYSANITIACGIEHNYSVDSLKRAAFVDEINNVLKVNNHIDQISIIYYLENRIKEIDKKYK